MNYNTSLVSTISIATTMAKLRAMADGDRRDVALVDATTFATLIHIRATGMDEGAGFELAFSDDMKRIAKRNFKPKSKL